MACISKADALVTIIFISIFIKICDSYTYEYPDAKKYTREISIKQGKLRGIEWRPKQNKFLNPVEQYLGIPYAAPPIGPMRFMPPGSAPQWSGTKYADAFGPVCPQKLPNTTNMPPERKKYLNSLSHFLGTQSEDCLYLNIYAPLQTEEERNHFPVMVFIHGESYEWNSGNPYDGSVLASYGRVIVVTLNFRLGILGFLKTGLEDNAQGNFGLVDQIAALLWIRENIAAFGGNPDSVTLFGHGTGAACTSLLMLSPMIQLSEGNKLLFQRAILMSGTALSDWALARKSREVTYQVAVSLNCPTDAGLLPCLRKKRLDEIMGANVGISPYYTKFGPVIDGTVVPNEPEKSMTKYRDLFSRFDILFGVTEIESLHLLNVVYLNHGMLERELDQELRNYLMQYCERNLHYCITRTLEEYKTLSLSLEEQQLGIFEDHERQKVFDSRDALLDILSDARTVVPLIQTGRYHVDTKSINDRFFYVFLKATDGIDHVRGQTFHGEELPYIFGVPLDGPKKPFDYEYSEHEQLLCETILSFWANFAYAGNPNVPKKENFISTYVKMNWHMFEVDWPSFDANEEFIYLGVPLNTGRHYRDNQTKYWTEVLPTIYNNYSISIKPKPPIFINPAKGEYKRFPTILMSPALPTNLPVRKTTDVYGIVKMKADDDSTNYRPINVDTVISRGPEIKQTSTMNILLTVGGIVLLVNVLLFLALYYKCSKLRRRSCVEKNGDVDESDTEQVTTEKPSRLKTVFEGNGCNIIQIIGGASKSDDPYEAIKVEGVPESFPPLTRQMSNSTIDAHTKVKEWIAQEVVQRCSPRYIRRLNKQNSNKSNKTHAEDNSYSTKSNRAKPPLLRSDTKTVESNSSLGQNSTRPVSPAEEVVAPKTQDPSVKPVKVQQHSLEKSTLKKQKVSVAVDATPSGRGSSVMRQQPIELTKSLDCPTIQREVDLPLRRSVTMEDICSKKDAVNTNPLTKSSTNINVELKNYHEPTVVKIKHFHSKSDPVEDLYSYNSPKILKTFDPTQDINVTSRDEGGDSVAELTPEQALMTIKRRNFPKVLPDFPSRNEAAHKRRSMPAPNILFMPIPEVPSLSQPSTPTEKIYCRFRPVPPPRISSTLGRKPTVQPSPICLSAPVLAEEPPIPEEPEVTCNNLYVGPLKKVKPDVQNNLTSKCSSQPIYDNLNHPRSLDRSEKQTPKTIVTADPQNPIKRMEPKVIIKPTISRSTSSDTAKNKTIPRVTVNDSTSNFPKRADENSGTENNERMKAAQTSNESNNGNKEKHHECSSGIPIKKVGSIKSNKQKSSQIPTLVKSTISNKEGSSDSSPSEESDTGTVKRVN